MQRYLHGRGRQVSVLVLELAIKGQAALVLVVKKQWSEVQHFREGKARPYRTPVPAKAHQTHVTTAPPHGCQLYPAVHRGGAGGRARPHAD